MNSAVVLLSSGLDSTVALAMAHQQGIKLHAAVTFNYGQKSATKEIEQSLLISKHYNVKHLVIDLPWLKFFDLNSALLHDKSVVPELEENLLEDTVITTQSARAVWVSNRNGIFINIAASLAEANNCNFVIVGFNLEEAATFSDNSKDFMGAINHSLSYSTQNKVTVMSPTVNLMKHEIVSRAISLEAPLPLVWSCYLGEHFMCGKCESCKRYKRAFKQCGVSHAATFAN